MKRVSGFLLAAGAFLAIAVAHAGTTLNGARIGAKDVAALAKFYQTAFGMQEVQRITMPNMLEVMLNFGATVDAAKANPASQIVIMQRAADDGKDTMPHIVFNVTDMAGVTKAVKTAGGTMEREPFEFGKTGIMIGMGVDPAGNHFEMIQQPRH
jgi:predicted enzyme related to lactoylglutathione lyase